MTFLTEDLDRLLAFYVRVFDAEVTLDMTEEGVRHAFLTVGPTTVLHPFQMLEGPGPPAPSPMFTRGRLDHFALLAPTEEAFRELRRRIEAEGAADGDVRDALAVDHGLLRPGRGRPRGDPPAPGLRRRRHARARGLDDGRAVAIARGPERARPARLGRRHPAFERIGERLAAQQSLTVDAGVGPRAPVQAFAARPAEERVVVAATRQLVVARRAEDEVHSPAREDAVVTRRVVHPQPRGDDLRARRRRR